MSDTTKPQTLPRRSFLQSMEIDTRLLGMIGAFLLVCIVFNILTDGRFLTPRNIFNLSIQTVSVAIMATGMVFVIVTRHIDLSVGALLATCIAVMGMTQTAWLPQIFGLELGHPMIPWITIAIGLVTGAVIGSFQGWLIGYQGIPAFIVTLGGLLIWRNVGWYLTDGATIGPLDKTFTLFGGISGTLGAFWSWVVGIAATALSLAALWAARRNKVSHGFPVKPVWAEALMMLIIAVAILGFVAILNAYTVPERVIARDTSLFCCVAAYGIPYSVLLLIAVAIFMTVVALKTRLGRYVFATGGNPDAAELSGINTRLLTVKIFAMVGVLSALGGVRAVDNVSIELHAGEVVGLLGHNGAGKSTLIKMLSGPYKMDAGEIWIEGKKVSINSHRGSRDQNIETIYQTLALADNLDAASNLFLGRELTTAFGFVDDSRMEAETREMMDLCDRVSVMKNGQMVGTERVEDVTEDDILSMIILGKNPKAAA